MNVKYFVHVVYMKMNACQKQFSDRKCIVSSQRVNKRLLRVCATDYNLYKKRKLKIQLHKFFYLIV
jgi:hypothetical protein